MNKATEWTPNPKDFSAKIVGAAYPDGPFIIGSKIKSVTFDNDKIKNGAITSAYLESSGTITNEYLESVSLSKYLSTER